MWSLSRICSFSRLFTRRPRRARYVRPRFRPLLEALEPRRLLASYTWLGTSTTLKWSDPNNWSPNTSQAGPTTGDTATFGDGTHNNGCTVDVSPSVQTLTVNNNYTGTIEIQAGNVLTTKGGSVSGGTLTLDSTAPGGGSTGLIVSGGALTISVASINGTSAPSGSSEADVYADGTGSELDLSGTVP